MGAPTWPPTPEDAEAATLAEYGDDARKVLPELDDEEAERVLLAPFLFGEPRRMLGEAEAGTALGEHRRALEGWASLIAGRPLRIAAADIPATDGHTLYLPATLPAPRRPAEDLLLYRVMALVQLGLATSGLLEQRPLLGEVHRDWVYRNTLHALLARASLARLVHRWPGLRADLEALRLLSTPFRLYVNHTPVPREGLPIAFEVLLEGWLQSSSKSVPYDRDPATSHAVAAARRARAAIDALPPGSPPSAALLVASGQASALRPLWREARLGPPPLPWIWGILRPEWVLDELSRDRRAEEAWREGPAPLQMLRRGLGGGRLRGALARVTGAPAAAPSPTFAAEDRPDQDAGAVYDEWDHARGLWRIGHCRVEEIEAPLASPESWLRLRESVATLLGEVRRRFEALRREDRWTTGQPDGAEIDLDRAIRATVDLRAGWSPPRVDWFRRYERFRRSVAVLVLVDLSGSVAGEVLHREQEALAAISEGLAVLGLAHALLGFSNDGPQRCTLQRVKGWDEPFDESAGQRIAGLRAAGASRLGAFVRHATATLARRPESRKLLLLVSDGRPEDRDGYRGEHGLRDTALAVAEARRHNVLTRAVSLDTRSEDTSYLPAIFGVGGYLKLDAVEELPARLPEILLKLVR